MSCRVAAAEKEEGAWGLSPPSIERLGVLHVAENPPGSYTFLNDKRLQLFSKQPSPSQNAKWRRAFSIDIHGEGKQLIGLCMRSPVAASWIQ